MIVFTCPTCGCKQDEGLRINVTSKPKRKRKPITPEKRREYQQRYFIKHPEKLEQHRAYTRQYALEHHPTPDKRSKYQRNWRERNPEKHAARMKLDWQRRKLKLSQSQQT